MIHQARLAPLLLGATGSGHAVVLQQDFRLDGAPVHALPTDIDPRHYTEVWLWCEAFSVPLGGAVLNTAP